MQKVIPRPRRGFGAALAIAECVFKPNLDIVRARLRGTSCAVQGPGQGCRVWRAAVVERDDSGRIVDDGQAFGDIARRTSARSLELEWT